MNTDGNGGRGVLPAQRSGQMQDYIAQVLLQEWDPIGVREYPEAQDEYDSYVEGVLRLLQTDASDETIVAHLLEIETIDMRVSIPSERERLEYIVEKLRGFLWGVSGQFTGTRWVAFQTAETQAQANGEGF
ncbi:MAG: hypothetical protein M3Y56_09595 [Armatimonadota bacterium]|nr:hypothetical protein [Armatimonadota bacterium]